MSGDRGQETDVRGQGSGVSGQRSGDRCQETDVRGQGSEVRRVLCVFVCLTCVCERPRAVNKDDVCREQHDDDAVRQSDEPTVPLR